MPSQQQQQQQQWLIYPIVFGIPEEDVMECVPYKTTDFATVVPCTLWSIK